MYHVEVAKPVNIRDCEPNARIVEVLELANIKNYDPIVKSAGVAKYADME